MNADGSRYVAANPNITQGNRRGSPQSGHGRHRKYQCRAQQLTPRLELIKKGEAIALDVEGVLLPDEVGSRKSGIGRVSIVNERGQVVYDTFVHYPRVLGPDMKTLIRSKTVNHRPSPQWLKLGVTYNDILPLYDAQPVEDVLKVVESACKKAGSIVCHAIDKEIRYMAGGKVRMMDGVTMFDMGGFDLEEYWRSDTQSLPEYRKHATGSQRNPSLPVLAFKVLHRVIQKEEHSSVEDAQATIDLYLRRRKDFEAIASPPSSSSTPTSDNEMMLSSTTTSLSSLTITDESDAPVTEPPAATIQKPAAEKVVVKRSWAQIVRSRPKPE